MKPFKLMLALQTYGLMVIFRTIAMYLTPLNPPNGIILLDDPFVQFFGQGEILTKDLFFSGHTATLFLLFLLTENKKLRMIFLASTFVVGACVLFQKVHYSIDVFAAFFFAFYAFRIVNYFHKTEMI
jgi:membrane-associated phospholipid phosphatase